MCEAYNIANQIATGEDSVITIENGARFLQVRRDKHRNFYTVTSEFGSEVVEAQDLIDTLNSHLKQPQNLYSL